MYEVTVSAIKKRRRDKGVRFFSDFSWWLKMLYLWFELFNQLQKRPFQLGKGKN
jgi:hypothetical protein